MPLSLPNHPYLLPALLAAVLLCLAVCIFYAVRSGRLSSALSQKTQELLQTREQEFRLQQLLDDEQNHSRLLEQENIRWQERYAETNNRTAEWTMRYDHLERQHSVLNEELSENKARIRELQTLLHHTDGQAEILQNENNTLQQHNRQLSQELSSAEQRAQRLQVLWETERQKLQDRETLAQTTQTMLTGQFKLLAQQILDDTGNKFSQQSQHNLNALLQPLNEQLQTFQAAVRSQSEKDTRERTELASELKRLHELNHHLHHEAQSLSAALAGNKNKTQGTWGEMILNSVLEHAGLRKGIEFTPQQSLNVINEEGGRTRIQPDVVVNLPDHKHILIDSKVSLTAYTRYIQAADNNDAKIEMSAHISSLRNHINSLSAKTYQTAEGIVSLDFVLMFVPNEAAYIAALSHAPEILQEGFDKHVLLVCPSTLLVTLKTIGNMWRDERMNNNAQEIAKTAGRLYDKLSSAMDDLLRTGKELDAAKHQYNQAMKRLSSGSGNVLRQAEQLRELGAKPNKRLPASLLASDTGYAEETLPEE